MFQWRMRGVSLMVAPLVSAARQQYARVDVSVVEETTPVYALVFTVAQATKRVERRVTKQLMARVFERAIALPRGRVATLRTRLLEEKDMRAEAFDDAVDKAVQAWISGETMRPPTREQLVKWLLSRMLLATTKGGGVLVLCGEDQDEDEDSGDGDADEAQEDTPRQDSRGDEQALCPTSPPPPPYSAGSSRSERAHSDSSDFPAFFGDRVDDDGDQGEAYSSCHSDSFSDDDDYYEQTREQSTVQTRPTKIFSQDVMVSEEVLTTRDLNNDDHDTDGMPMVSSYRFEPAKERINSQRRHSHSSSFAPPNAWAEERRQFTVELTQSKRDIEIAQERQRKAQVIATLKRKQAVEQSKKKLLAHEQKLRDARFVKQSIADTLEYHDIIYRLESKVKQTRIAASREQEKLTQSMRVTLGGSGDKWRKGPVVGTGPLSQIEIDLLVRGDRKAVQPSMWVYDLHGRRHHESNAGAVAAENVFDSAMKKIQRLLDRKPTESVDLFRNYDLDHSGTLEYSELQHLLGENSVELSSKQAKTLFRHFDPNRSGAIDYGELLWGLFNRRAFLKRWKQRKTKLSAKEIKQKFYKYDRVGRGALSPLDFQVALEDIGFRVSESEAKLLCLKFDTNKDGFIDYSEFHAFVNDDAEEEEGEEDHSRGHTIVKGDTQSKPSEKRPNIRLFRRRSTTGNAISISNNESDVERILAELRALNDTQETIRRSLASTY